MNNEQIVLLPISLDALLKKVQEIVTKVLEGNQEDKFQAMLLSPAEACKLFNPKISKVTLHEWTKKGLIPSHRIGGRVFYKVSELIESARPIKKYDRNKQLIIE
jgi:hypothetical protein